MPAPLLGRDKRGPVESWLAPQPWSQLRHIIVKRLKSNDKNLEGQKWYFTCWRKIIAQLILNQKPEISARKNPHNIFLKMKTTNPEFCIQQKYHSTWKGQDTLRWKKTRELVNKQTSPKKMARGSSLNRKEMIKEGILEHRVGRKNNGKGKTWIYMVVFFVFLSFLNYVQWLKQKLHHWCGSKCIWKKYLKQFFYKQTYWEVNFL